MKKYFILPLIPFVFIFFFTNCKSDSKQINKNYKFYNLEQQGWKSKRVNEFVNGINYTATEVPLQYYILKNNQNHPEIVDSLYTLYNKERVIEIEFEHSKQKDLLKEEFTNRNYEDAVKYMAFTIKQDFAVVTSSNDTIKCSGVNFERNFKVAPFKRVLLYFNAISPDDDIKLLYNDQLFGNGTIQFNFNEAPIKL